MKNIKSKRGARRAYNAIINKCYREARGGTQYGIDYPTLHVLWPDRYAELKNIQALFALLPE